METLLKIAVLGCVVAAALAGYAHGGLPGAFWAAEGWIQNAVIDVIAAGKTIFFAIKGVL